MAFEPACWQAWFVWPADVAPVAPSCRSRTTSELPILTVSRLAQPPVILRALSRSSIAKPSAARARELADVLRLVPGYLVGGFKKQSDGRSPLRLILFAIWCWSMGAGVFVIIRGYASRHDGQSV
jgi:hypothetical protein